MIPLPPVVFDEGTWFESLRDLLDRCGPGRIILGLNNPAHLIWAKRLEHDGRISFFIDYGLYCANRFAFRFFLREVPRLSWVSHWIEGSGEDRETLRKAVADERVPLIGPDPSFRPPLFISRICFRRHGGILPCAGCPTGNDGERREEELHQVGKRFRLVSEDCLSYLFPSAP